jgi:hypothetical protein
LNRRASIGDDYGSRGAIGLVAAAVGLMLLVYAASLLLYSLAMSDGEPGPVLETAATELAVTASPASTPLDAEVLLD